MTTVAPFVRTLELGARGPDAFAVKRALKAAGYDDPTLAVKPASPDADLFGGAAVANTKTFQQIHGLTIDGVYGSATHAALARYFDAYGISLLDDEQKALAPRAQIVAVFRWMIAHKSLFDYAEVRPIPVNLPKEETTQRIVTDCSGSVTLAAKWAGCPDPNGLGFDGQGYTGTLLNHCAHIPQGEAAPGDLIVYGAAPGHHVVAILGVLNESSDFSIFSHGHPGDPELTTHSAMHAEQSTEGYSDVTFLRWLP